VEWEVMCDRAVTAGEIVREPGAAIALDIDRADARIARARVAPSSSFAYRFRWTHGPGFIHEGKVSYAVKLIPDAVPRIEVLRPDPEEKGTVRKEVEIAFRAKDDFGLGDAAIVFAVNEGPEGRRPLGSLGGWPPDAPLEARWRPAESIPELKEGDQVRYRIEVADNRAPQPNAVRSPLHRIAVVSVDEYLRSISEKRARLTARIGGILREEDEGSKNVKTIEDIAR